MQRVNYNYIYVYLVGFACGVGMGVMLARGVLPGGPQPPQGAGTGEGRPQ